MNININLIDLSLLLFYLPVLAYLFYLLEKKYHYLFLLEIKKENIVTTEEKYLFKKYNVDHSLFFMIILYVGIMIFTDDFIPKDSLWEDGWLIIITPFAIIMGLLAAFDYRMRLLPDTFIIMLGFLSLIVFLYFLEINHEVMTESDFKDLLLEELWVKAIFIVLPVIGFIAFYYDKLDMGFGDIKLLTALIPLPYEWFNLSIIVFLTVIFSIIYIMIARARKSKMDSAPVATMCALAIPISFLIPALIVN